MNKFTLIKLRKQAELTQTDFCKMCGVSLRTVQYWEAGKTKMTQLQISAIVQIFKRLGLEIAK